jgi:hypothetical protein
MRGSALLRALASLLALAAPALASNRGGLGTPASDAPRPAYEESFAEGVAGVAWRSGGRAWRSGSALVKEAARDLGSGKFTPLPGP